VRERCCLAGSIDSGRARVKTDLPINTPTSVACSEWWVLICTSVPSFMLQLDANIVSVSLPSIARSLAVGFSGIEWVVTAYVLSFASLLMPAGALADRFGRKQLLLVGLSIFTVASFLCGSASSLPALVAARVLQGAGAALQLSSALAILSHTFQGEARARAFAFWGVVIGIGIAAGPVVGGLITQAFGWRWAFYVNLPIGLVLLAMIVKVIVTSRDPHAARLDLSGAACFGSALLLTTLALVEGNLRGWSDRWIVGELLSASALFALFIVVEQRQKRPMLDLSYFRIPTFLGATAAQLAFAAGMLTMLTFVPVFLQGGLGASPAAAGLMMLPMVAPQFVVPFVVSRCLAHTLSGRALLTIGLSFVCVGLCGLAATVGTLRYWPLVGGMFIIGIGAGILNSETAKVGMTVVPKERSGMASSFQGTIRFTGLSIGIAMLGVVLNARVGAIVSRTFPALSSVARYRLVQNIVVGHSLDSLLPSQGPGAARILIASSFVEGYRALFLFAAAFMLVSAFLSWSLISSEAVPPVGGFKKHRKL
jgi:EmrB/QacA subfamily drug resistance transporter